MKNKDWDKKIKIFRELAMKQGVAYLETLSEEDQNIFYTYIFEGMAENLYTAEELAWLTPKEIDGIIKDMKEE